MRHKMILFFLVGHVTWRSNQSSHVAMLDTWTSVRWLSWPSPLSRTHHVRNVQGGGSVPMNDWTSGDFQHVKSMHQDPTKRRFYSMRLGEWSNKRYRVMIDQVGSSMHRMIHRDEWWGVILLSKWPSCHAFI